MKKREGKHPFRGGRDPYYWSDIAGASEVIRMIVKAMEETEASFDAVTMQEIVSREMWTRARKLELIREFPGHGTAWKPWGFTESAAWLIQSIEHTEKWIKPIRLLLEILDSCDENKKRDWIHIMKQLGPELKEALKDEEVVWVNDEGSCFGRVFDGEGHGWTPWGFTEHGAYLVKLARGTVAV